MQTETAPTEAANIPHLFTVAEYMALNIPWRTELIEGVIYDVAPKNEPHVLAVTRLNKILTPALPQYFVRVQDPIAVSGWTGKNDPEIDIAVVADRSYSGRATNADSFARARTPRHRVKSTPWEIRSTFWALRSWLQTFSRQTRRSEYWRCHCPLFAFNGSEQYVRKSGHSTRRRASDIVCRVRTLS